MSQEIIVSQALVWSCEQYYLFGLQNRCETENVCLQQLKNWNPSPIKKFQVQGQYPLQMRQPVTGAVALGEPSGTWLIKLNIQAPTIFQHTSYRDFFEAQGTSALMFHLSLRGKINDNRLLVQSSYLYPKPNYLA